MLEAASRCFSIGITRWDKDSRACIGHFSQGNYISPFLSRNARNGNLLNSPDGDFASISASYWENTIKLSCLEYNAKARAALSLKLVGIDGAGSISAWAIRTPFASLHRCFTRRKSMPAFSSPLFVSPERDERTIGKRERGNKLAGKKKRRGAWKGGGGEGKPMSPGQID